MVGEWPYSCFFLLLAFLKHHIESLYIYIYIHICTHICTYICLFHSLKSFSLNKNTFDYIHKENVIRIYTFILVFNWNHFEMRLLNLRINFYLLRTFCPHLGSFVLFLLSLRFGQISHLAFFRWFTATSDRNAESCNRIPSNYCLP